MRLSLGIGSAGIKGARKNASPPLFGWFTEGFGTPRLTNARSLLDELRSRRRTMETIRQPVSVDPRRTTADSMVVRVVASHLVVPLTRAIGSVLVVVPRGKSVVGS